MFKKLIFSVVLLFITRPIFAQLNNSVNPDSIPFAPAVNYPAGDGPSSVFCADLDKDGDLDLTVANFNSNTVSILLNNGDGTFHASVNYGVGTNPLSVFCAELDGDGNSDLATANWDGGIYGGFGNVSILKNSGNGTFQTKVDYIAGDSPHSVFCSDLDGDLDLDLAVANNYGASVSILKNNGDGTFQGAVDYGLASYPTSVFCADLDGDLDLDLALTVGDWYSGYVFVLKNNGNGTFQNAVSYGVGSNPYSVFCADLDGDGYKDLAVANAFGDNISILKNNGDGTFQNSVFYNVGDTPTQVFCADLDGDFDLDLATNGASDNVSILKNNGDGTFQTKVDYGAGDGPHSVFCADLDNDRDLDLAVANFDSDNISILLNLSNLARPNSYPLISPLNADSTKTPVTLNWQTSIDPDPNDTVRYDLYLSRSIVFNLDSTIVYDSLLDTTFTDSLDIETWHWKVKAYDKWEAVRWSEQSWSFYAYVCGDCNGDVKITVSDVVYEINYLFKGGISPKPVIAGDVNCDGKETVSDVVYTINYLFKGGPPVCKDCP